MAHREVGRLSVVIAILLVAAAGFCLLDGAHDGLDLCTSMLPATAGVVLVGLLIAGALAFPAAPPDPPLVPARTAPAPV